MDAIIGGGAAASVIGSRKCITICDIIGTKPIVLELRNNYPQYHDFGTNRNSSKPEKIIRRGNVPIPIEQSE